VFNLGERPERRGDPSVDAEYRIRYDRRERQAVEDFAENQPSLRVQLRPAFLRESEDLRHVDTLVISSKKEDVLRITKLEHKEEANHFDGFRAAIDVIAKKKPRLEWRKAALFEGAEKVRELSVNVAAYVNWRLQAEECRF
jgi:hypothetical protein